MKKIVSLVLAAMLALTCAAAVGEAVPQPEGGKKFESSWAIFGMTVGIVYEEEGYRVFIRSSDPAGFQGTDWEYSCYYDEEKDALLSVSSSKTAYKEDPETGDFEYAEPEYQDIDEENQVTAFTIDGRGKLLWEDGRGRDGADLEFTKIGSFMGTWRSEDGKTLAEIVWSDSEEGDEYGYTVYLYEEGDDDARTYSHAHGLYDPETGKLTAAGFAAVGRMNAEGEFIQAEGPEEEAELVFSELGGGRILLERENAVELVYDLLGESDG